MKMGLPELDDTGSPTDFSTPEFEQARNAFNGIVAAFDEYQRTARAIAANPSYDQYRPQYRAPKMAEARAAVASEVLKTVKRCEGVAATLEKEAAELGAQLIAPEPIDPVQVTINLRSFRDLSRTARVETIHRIAQVLADPESEPQTKSYGRAYLGALTVTNPCEGLIDDSTRRFLSEVLIRTKNAEGYDRLRHLLLASRAIREVAQRVRALVDKLSSL
jgi:hypothetical protein